MARRISSSRSRSSSGGFRASSGGFHSSSRLSTFRPSSTRHVGGYRYRSNPYQRDYFFHSLSPTGKVIYVIVVMIIVIISISLGY